MNTITFDYNNVLANRVGFERGITDDDINALIGTIQSVHKTVQQKRDEKILGFYYLNDENVLNDIINYANDVKNDFENLVVLGIGGSALGITALKTALRPFQNELPNNKRKGLKVYVLDNIDPDFLHSILDNIDINKTLFNVITKSGSTAETISQFLIVYDMLKQYSDDFIKKHIVCTTDAEKGNLREVVNELGLKSFVIPQNVGGRFSIFSPVGLLPAALMEIDIKALLQGQQDLLDYYDKIAPEKNPSYIAGLIAYLLDKKFNIRNNVIMPYSVLLKDIADWFRQLWAESLGKKHLLSGDINNIGLTPIKAVGVTDQHSQIQLYNEGPNDKYILFLHINKSAQDYNIPKHFEDKSSMGYLGGHTMKELFDVEFHSTELALLKNHRPNATIHIPEVNEYYFGQLIFFFEVMTVFTGYLYNINPLDQPGVEEGKHFTYGLLGRKGYEHKKQEFEEYPAKDTQYIIPLGK